MGLGRLPMDKQRFFEQQFTLSFFNRAAFLVCEGLFKVG